MSPLNLDYFNRQEKIPWFNQRELKSLAVSVLGMGGIGTNISLLLNRLGIGKVMLIDFDKIEASNLNRQTLYSKKDIGRIKVDVAKETLDDLDNLDSENVAYNYDLFADWKKTIKIIEESDYVMNGLDLPEIKRTLMGILCYNLKKPMIYCGTDPTSGYSGMVLYQSSKRDEPCHECLQAVLNTVENEDKVKKYATDNILEHETINWMELEGNNYKEIPNSGATNIITAMFCSTLAVNVLLHSIFNHPVNQRIIFDLYIDSIEGYKLEKRPDCLVCGI